MTQTKRQSSRTVSGFSFVSVSMTSPPTVDRPEILNREQVAAWLQVRPRQVERLGVPCLRLGHRTLRYRCSDVERWLAERAERT